MAIETPFSIQVVHRSRSSPDGAAALASTFAMLRPPLQTANKKNGPLPRPRLLHPLYSVSSWLSHRTHGRTRSTPMSLRAQLKTGLKPFVVPIWNAVHHGAWIAYDYSGAVASGRFGRCNVCGRVALFIYRRRVVTQRLEEARGLTPRLAEALARKESGDWRTLRRKLRGRRLAQVLLSLDAGGAPLPRVSRAGSSWPDPQASGG